MEPVVIQVKCLCFGVFSIPAPGSRFLRSAISHIILMLMYSLLVSPVSTLWVQYSPLTWFLCLICLSILLLRILLDTHLAAFLTYKVSELWKQEKVWNSWRYSSLLPQTLTWMTLLQIRLSPLIQHQNTHYKVSISVHLLFSVSVSSDIHSLQNPAN